MKFNKTILAQCLGVVFYSSWVVADEPSATLKTVSVISQAQVATTSSSTYSATDLKKTGVQNIDDVAQNDPAVDVKSDGMRMGNKGFNIRGITNERIKVTLDDISLPTAYDDIDRTASSLSIGSDNIEFDTIKSVEIHKNADASTFGEGALGGVVQMKTFDPADFVSEEKPYYAGLKYGYHSAYRSHGATVSLAGKSHFAEGLLMLTERRLHETDNEAELDINGEARTTNNDQDSTVRNLLAKLNVGNQIHRLETAYEHYYKASDIILGDLLGSRTARNTTSGLMTTTHRPIANADDLHRREKIGVTYRYLPENSALAEFNFGGYYQKSESKDRYFSQETQTSNASSRTTETRYNNRLLERQKGVRSEAIFRHELGSVVNVFSFGAELSHQDFDRYKATSILNEMGVNTAAIPEDRMFPQSNRTDYAFSVKNNTLFGNGVQLLTGVRYDHSKLEFTRSSVDRAVRNNAYRPSGHLKFTAFSPNVRLNLPVSEHTTLFAGYTRGFKAPTPQQVGMGFESLIRGLRYAGYPNYNLKPETSNNFEVGVIYDSERVKTQLTLFNNLYKNFIEGTEILPPLPGYMRRVHFINKDRVKTYGIELSNQFQLGDYWKLTNSVALMGSKTSDGSVLDSAYPLSGVIGLEYDRENWGVGSKVRWADNKSKVSNPSYFKAPGYGVWDLTAFYKPSKHLEFNVAVLNVLDKKYWTNADVAGVPHNALIDRYTQPGRSFVANVELKF